jgi:hypothetical protein
MKLQLDMSCQSYTQKRIRFISHDFRLSSFAAASFAPEKINSSRSLSSFAEKLDLQFAIQIIYSEYNKIIIKLKSGRSQRVAKDTVVY